MSRENVLSFVMAGGNGCRLKILTKDRCKPAINILGSYKIFDFVASNIVNTGIPITLVATQFKPESLCSHIKRVWEASGSGNRFEIINPDESNIPTFEGTADSVRKSIELINRHNPDIVLVLGADHIYFMDYKDAIMQHEKRNADITIMTNVIPDNKVSDFGIVKINEFGRIIDFAEKPTDKEIIDSFRLHPGMKKCLGIEDPNMNFLASMGNYVFDWERLKRFMEFPGADFGKDIIPAIKSNGGVLYAYVFNGYWRDVGKVQDYYNCNMEFTRKPTSLWKSWTGISEESLPSPQLSDSSYVRGTILSSGDIIGQKNNITDSVIGQNVKIEEGCTLDHCIILGADMNELSQVNEYAITRIDKSSHLDHVILDKNTWVGKGVDISPQNKTIDRRREILQSIGLKPYKELGNGMVEGDFYIEPETDILVIGEQHNTGRQKLTLPDGLKC